jgi:succinyl-CoA:acetate CoA-transferase
VDVVVTEHGLADLRNLAPRQAALEIINKCADPAYRDLLRDYYQRALKKGGHEPQLLEEAFAFHLRYQDTGDMRPRPGAPGGA